MNHPLTFVARQWRFCLLIKVKYTLSRYMTVYLDEGHMAGVLIWRADNMMLSGLRDDRLTDRCRKVERTRCPDNVNIPIAALYCSASFSLSFVFIKDRWEVVWGPVSKVGIHKFSVLIYRNTEGKSELLRYSFSCVYAPVKDTGSREGGRARVWRQRRQ